MKIRLIGLGVNSRGLSLGALDAIKSSKVVLCRTENTQSARIFAELGIEAIYLDSVYEHTRNFDSLNSKLAREVLLRAKTSDVVYCVDGSVSADNSCSIIIAKHKDTEIIDGASRCCEYLAKCGISGSYAAFSAYDKDKFVAPSALPVIVYDLDGAYLASEWKIILSDAFGDEAPVVLCNGNEKKDIFVYELDRQSDYGYATAVIIKETSLIEKKRFNTEDLFKILYRLRGENGCPWDRVQTRDSIKKNLIEECYELYDAILADDADMLCEETGDVLLQIAFQIVFSEEQHIFNRTDVVSALCEKLISRHTHVFGSDRAKDGTNALEIWEKNKATEKGYVSGADYLDKVPKCFPAAMRAQKLQKRAAKYNFEFSKTQQIYDKIDEETQEIKSAVASGNSTAIEDEVGDLLFTAVNLARNLGVDAEEALRFSCEKFFNRFSKLEAAVNKDGKNMKDLTEEQLDEYYNEIKKH